MTGIKKFISKSMTGIKRFTTWLFACEWHFIYTVHHLHQNLPTTYKLSPTTTIWWLCLGKHKSGPWLHLWGVDGLKTRVDDNVVRWSIIFHVWCCPPMDNIVNTAMGKLYLNQQKCFYSSDCQLWKLYLNQHKCLYSSHPF